MLGWRVPWLFSGDLLWNCRWSSEDWFSFGTKGFGVAPWRPNHKISKCDA